MMTNDASACGQSDLSDVSNNGVQVLLPQLYLKSSLRPIDENNKTKRQV